MVQDVLNGAQSTFRHDVGLALAQLGVDFVIPPGEQPKFRVVQSFWFTGSMNQLEFMSKVGSATRALLIVKLLLGKELLKRGERATLPTHK